MRTYGHADIPRFYCHRSPHYIVHVYWRRHPASEVWIALILDTQRCRVKSVVWRSDALLQIRLDVYTQGGFVPGTLNAGCHRTVKGLHINPTYKQGWSRASNCGRSQNHLASMVPNRSDTHTFKIERRRKISCIAWDAHAGCQRHLPMERADKTACLVIHFKIGTFLSEFPSEMTLHVVSIRTITQ
jgi:hypothetical protein